MATVTTGQYAAAGWKRPAGFRPGQVLPWVLLVVLAGLVLYPLALVIASSFRSEPPGQAGTFSLQGWQTVLTSPEVVGSLFTTFRLVIPKVFLAVLVASSFAWLMARTNIPFKPVLEGVLAFMFFVPTLPWVLSWTLLISPKSGFVNLLLAPILPGDFRFNAYSYEALVILGAMNSVPILFLLLYPAFRNMDPALEEAAQACGGTRFSLLRRVTFPLLAPAILAAAALSTVVGMESFEVEQLLGVPAGLFVFTTRIYDLLYSRERAQFGAASALSMVLLLFTVVLLLVQRRILAGRVFSTVTGKGYRARDVDLGTWRWLAFAYVAAYLLIFGVLPFAMLLVNSFMQVSGFVDPAMFNTRGWTKAFTSPQLVTSVQNTVLVGVCTATLGVLVVSMASYTVTRLRWKGRSGMDLMLWLPIAVPGMVLALGFLWAFVSLPIYQTIWVLMLAYLIRGLPTSSRFFTSTMVQIGAELEEASWVHGSSWLHTLVHIWRPLLLPAVLSAWIYLFVISVRTLDSALLLTGPKSEVLSVSIFQQASRGDGVLASALALIQVAIVLVAYLLTRLVGRRRLPEQAVS